MKKSTKLFFKTFIISAWCLAVFLGIGYYYLSKNLTPTENKTQKVPYYQEVPENAGILFDIMGDKTFIYFDFENSKISASLNLQENRIYEDEIYGYSVDYKINADLELISDLVDYLEGVELTYESETLRYTGVQVIDVILSDKEKEQKSKLLKAIAEKIARNGIGKDILLHVVEKYETNLTVPDFYYWPEYIKKICPNLQIIDS